MKPSKTKDGEEIWLEFKDRFGNKLKKDMKLENWIKNKNTGFDQEQLKKLIEENEYIWI